MAHSGADEPVHLAAAADAEELTRLLSRQPDLRDKPGWFGRRPLHAASSAGNGRSVEILLAQGADPNAEEALHRDTPLILAVEADSELCVKRLLEGGAEPNKPGRRGQTPLFVARSRSVLQQLFEAGAKADVRDQNGDSPIQNCASYVGSLEVLRFWIEQGAELNAAPTVGWPPLHGIVGGGLSEHRVTETQRVEMLQLLVEHGASLDLKDKSGETALFHASRHHLHLTECVRFLLERGSEPNLARPTGDTPLLMAVDRGYLDIVELLLKHGADPSVPNRYHVYPVDLCNDNPELRQLLEPRTVKVERPVPSPESVVNRLQAIPSFSKVRLNGCTDQEIAALEGQLAVRLPESYRQFLRVLGRGAGDFMVSDHWYFKIEDVPELAQSDEYAEYCDLPENHFVFACRNGYYWVFFIADGTSDDPPVFSFDDGEDRAYQPAARTVWEFVESQVIYFESFEKG